MKTLFTLISALALASAVNAQDKQPGIPEAQKLMQRAKEAKEAGRNDEARELAEQAQKIGGARKDEKRQKGDRGPDVEKGPPGEKPHPMAGGGPEKEDKLAHARHVIEELHRAGKHEEAEQMKRRVAGFMEHEKGASARHEKGPQPDEGEGPARLRHVMEAIRHLREAGLNEPAEGLEKIARGMREQFEHREHAETEKGRRPEPGLKEGPPRGANKMHPPGDELHAMREQMEKMARAIEELRAQIRGHGDEEVRKPRKE